MSKEISFVIKELCELYALDDIIHHTNRLGLLQDYSWKIFLSPVNTDLDIVNPITFLRSKGHPVILDNDHNNIKEKRPFGFSSTGKSHENDQYVKEFFDISKVLSCRMIPRGKPLHKEKKTIVIGNTKIDYPLTSLQHKFVEIASGMPYHFIWVPRHPSREISPLLLQLPNNIKLYNSIGLLTKLQASADLTIMGRMLSENGMEDTEHNPVEATVNSFTICGKLNQIAEAYKWLFLESGLVTSCPNNPLEALDLIGPLLARTDLENLLFKKQQWIQENRNRRFSDISISLAKLS